MVCLVPWSLWGTSLADGVNRLPRGGGGGRRRGGAHASSHQALFSPSTGIVDSHALTLSLQGEAEAAGAVVALRTAVRKAEVGEAGEVVVDYYLVSSYVVTVGLSCILREEERSLAVPHT